MRFLTTEQCREFALGLGWPSAPPDIAQLEAAGWLVTRFAIPKDAGRRIALVRELWALIERPSRLLWVTDWGVWPSGEHMPLYTALRTACGDRRPLVEAPGHECELSESDDGLSVLVVGSVFLWDAWVLAGSDSALFMSHDEWGAHLTTDPGAAS